MGFRVVVPRERWEYIVNEKHPAMAGREGDVAAALESPDVIRRSRSDQDVLLFYRSMGRKRWVCVVLRPKDGAALLITAYPTDAIKRGVQIWPPSA
ncbi:MAG: DUF4258 domain-containing protein [Dehalococcoidia bacterium]|nr:DUF4258 domain-containing protein [Dehalococcoidia bacterium]